MTTDSAVARSDNLRQIGRMCWAVVGIAAAAAIAAATLGAFAGLVVPLVVAAVTGTLLHPPVDRLERAGLPRSIGSGLVLIGLTVISVFSVWVTVVGVIDQSVQISQQVTGGLEYLDREVGGRWDPTGGADAGSVRLGNALPGLFGGCPRGSVRCSRARLHSWWARASPCSSCTTCCPTGDS